jgi:hypothetical protein
MGMHLAGESLVRFLQHSYNKTEMSKTISVAFVQFGTGNIPEKTPGKITIGLTLYRVGWNEHLRSHAPSPRRKAGPLALDLYYLVSSWGGNAHDEQVPFAWTLLQLHQTPILDSSILRGEANWSPSEYIEMVPQDLPHDELSRIWDKLSAPFRLSAAYVARVIRLEPHKNYEEFLPVVARRTEMYSNASEERDQ